MNYRIWLSDCSESEILVEVFNSCDIWEVQKEFVNKGYIIDEYWDTNNSSYIKMYKKLNEE